MISFEVQPEETYANAQLLKQKLVSGFGCHDLQDDLIVETFAHLSLK